MYDIIVVLSTVDSYVMNYVKMVPSTVESWLIYKVIVVLAVYSR